MIKTNKISRLMIGLLFCSNAIAANTPAHLYEKAVHNSKQCHFLKPETLRLFAISEDNPALVYNSSSKQVLVATWIPQTVLHIYQQPHLITPMGRDLWVTAVPEIKNHCELFAGSLLTTDLCGQKTSERLNQLLGLAPLSENKIEYNSHIVEIWVHVNDLYRPCDNPQIDTLNCHFESPTCAVGMNAHAQWMEKTGAANGERFPWTELGYTYDWGAADSNLIGASEYVVRQGAAVVIHQVIPTAVYCGCAL